MTTQKHRKRLVRARMAQTGETYQSAHRAVEAGRLRRSPALDTGRAAPLAASDVVRTDDGSGQARIGNVLAGRYRLLEVVENASIEFSQDFFPTVLYRAEHILLGGEVDIKVLPKSVAAENPHLRAWVLREGRALRRAAHPQVPRVFDIGETEEHELYLVLEPLPRATLAARLDGTEVDEDFAATVLGQLASVLRHLHQNGVVHRGLRNCAIHLAEHDGKVAVRLAGFELAGLAGDPRLAPPGAVFGYATWMSPEQCRGEEADERSDLYSLGIVLYTMLAGRLPFWDRDKSKLLALQCAAPPPPIRKPGSPASPLDPVCLKLLAKERGARFPNAAGLLETLSHLSASRAPHRPGEA